MRKYNLRSSMEDRVAWDAVCEASIDASIEAVKDDEEVMAYILANPMEYVGDLWEQELNGITDDEDDEGMIYIDDLEEAKARFQEVAHKVINNMEIAGSITVWEYCGKCDYEREFPIPDMDGMRVEYIEECPECGAFLEREFGPNKVVLDTIQISSSTPSQSDSPGGWAYTTGEEANVYWSYRDQSYGFYTHGIADGGNAFEGDDNDGFSSMEEVIDHIQENYK